MREAPTTAFEMAYRMVQVVRTLVGRPIQVAIVKGLKRNLKIYLALPSYLATGTVELTLLQPQSYSISCPSWVT